MQQRSPQGGIVGENQRYYSGGQFLPFYKPRPLMPQVDDKAYPALCDWFAFMGVRTVKETVCPSDLTPHQRIDRHKAQAIPDSVMAIPLLVSADGFILDGNHRWLAHKERGLNVKVLRVALDFDDAIAALFQFLRDTSGATLDHELSN